jgi:hypothetical protein
MYFYFFKFTRTNRRRLLPQGKHNPCHLCYLCDLKAAKQRKAEGRHFCAFRDLTSSSSLSLGIAQASLALRSLLRRFCVTSFSPSGESKSV